jgi:uncharacterized protein YodC (DUF2158 family)
MRVWRGDMAEFKVGDTVELKSGGPVMTVTGINDSGSLRCAWFAPDNSQARVQDFPAAALKPVNSE